MIEHKISPGYSNTYSYDKNYSDSLSKEFLELKYNLYIIYFINCLLNKNYIEWINFAIEKIKKYKYKEFYLCATVNSKSKKIILIELEKIHNIKFIFNYENEHEYPAINTLHRLSKIFNKTTDIFLYFHSKYITHTDHFNANSVIYDLLNKYYVALNVYEVFPKINKCVVSTENGKVQNRKGGLGWYNFYYARGSYLDTIETPEKTNKRYYYERWLSYSNGRKKTEKFISDCYSFDIKKYNIGEFWHPKVGYYYPQS